MSIWPRLLSTGILVFAGLGCGASAKVTRTTPVANLQSYQVVGVRAKGGGHLSRALAASAVRELSKSCQFRNVELRDYAQSKPDLVLDLKIHRSWRGGTGIIQNRQKATVDVLMVLSDGVDKELLGSAWIRGESATLNLGGSPEEQALFAVAKTVAKVMGKSGCKGPRVARAPDPPTTIAKNVNNGGNTSGGNTSGGNTTGGNTTGGNTDGGNTSGGNTSGGNTSGGTTDGGNTSGGTTSGGTTDGGNISNQGSDDAKRKAEAEALNKAGKDLFIAADVSAAVAKFVKASEAYPDPRYDFNICLGYEMLKRYGDAVSMCKRVLSKNPSAKLRGKAQKRLKIIAELRKKSK